MIFDSTTEINTLVSQALNPLFSLLFISSIIHLYHVLPPILLPAVVLFDDSFARLLVAQLFTLEAKISTLGPSVLILIVNPLVVACILNIFTLPTSDVFPSGCASGQHSNHPPKADFPQYLGDGPEGLLLYSGKRKGSVSISCTRQQEDDTQPRSPVDTPLPFDVPVVDTYLCTMLAFIPSSGDFGDGTQVFTVPTGTGIGSFMDNDTIFNMLRVFLASNGSILVSGHIREVYPSGDDVETGEVMEFVDMDSCGSIFPDRFMCRTKFGNRTGSTGTSQQALAIDVSRMSQATLFSRSSSARTTPVVPQLKLNPATPKFVSWSDIKTVQTEVRPLLEEASTDDRQKNIVSRLDVNILQRRFKNAKKNSVNYKCTKPVRPRLNVELLERRTSAHVENKAYNNGHQASRLNKALLARRAAAYGKENQVPGALPVQGGKDGLKNQEKRHLDTTLLNRTLADVLASNKRKYQKNL